jgi:hypothetical protein
MRYHSPVQPAPLTVGQQILLAGDPHPWTVKATTENFAALTRQMTVQERMEFDTLFGERRDEVLYTVLDWRNGVRGPCNLSGQGYGDGDYTEAECAQMLAEFEAGELEVSHRNQVPIRFGEVTW